MRFDWILIFTARQQILEKVMFSVISVILSVHGGGDTAYDVIGQSWVTFDPLSPYHMVLVRLVHLEAAPYLVTSG